MHQSSSRRCLSPASTRVDPSTRIDHDGKTFPIFKPDGSPNGHELRRLVHALKKPSISDPKIAFSAVIEAMQPYNAVRIYRNLCSITEDTWMNTLLASRLEELNFVFAEAIYLKKRIGREMIVRIPGTRDGQIIIYVHPPGRRKEIKHGERVIVPRFPRGKRYHKLCRDNITAYLHVLYPARPWRRNREPLTLM